MTSSLTVLLSRPSTPPEDSLRRWKWFPNDTLVFLLLLLVNFPIVVNRGVVETTPVFNAWKTGVEAALLMAKTA